MTTPAQQGSEERAVGLVTVGAMWVNDGLMGVELKREMTGYCGMIASRARAVVTLAGVEFQRETGQSV